jgi:hypothetical protein
MIQYGYRENLTLGGSQTKLLSANNKKYIFE